MGRLRVTEPELVQGHRPHPPNDRLRRASGPGRGCYQLPSGVYFDTSRDPGYGHFPPGPSRPARRGQGRGGRRQTPPDRLRHLEALAPSERRQMEWELPWGRGAPGWHLECSVMAMRHLGPHFDVHTGGMDHIPVHHTNEIAQSQAYLADGQPWVAWWLHGEFINLRGAKISKSTGGGVLVEDLLDRGYHPLVYRFLLLQSHYRQQTEFSWEAMDAARAGLRRLIDRLAAARTAPAGSLSPAAHRHLKAFDQAICDDLNTAAALAVVSAASRDEQLTEPELASLAAEFDSVLALGLVDLRTSDLDIKPVDINVSDDQIEALVVERNQARAREELRQVR